MGEWRIMFVTDEYQFTLRTGHESDVKSYYDGVYKEHRGVYLLLSPQEYKEMFLWDF